MDKLKKKNNLYKLLKSHYEYSLKKKAMFYYKNYTNFKTEQRYCDMVLVSQVVQMRQRNIIQKWHRVQIRREAMKKLSFLSERALKCVVLRGMIDRFNYQNAVVEYCQKQRPNYLQLAVVNRLKGAVQKTKMLNNAVAIVNERKQYWSLKVNFTAWHKEYSTLKRNYTTYAFIAVQLKRKITQNCFESLKVFAQYKKNKKVADLYYDRLIKQKLLNTMYNYRITSDKHYEASSKIMTARITKIKRESLQAWLDLYKEMSAQRIKLESHLRAKEISLTKNILKEWKAYSSEKARLRAISERLQAKTEIKKVTIGYKDFRTAILKIKDIKAKSQKADIFHNTKLVKAVKSAWVDQVLQNRDITQKVVRIREMRKRKAISKCWDIMLQKTEDIRAKIRCLKSVTKIPIRMEYRLSFQKWIDLVISERNLEAKTEKAQKYFNQKKISVALAKLIDDHRYQVERRSREQEIDNFYFYKQARNIFEMFREFLDIQREKRDKLRIAIRYRKDKLIYKGMNSWQQFMKDNYELFIKRRAMIKRLKERNCPLAFKKWSLFAEKHRIHREESEKALGLLNHNLKQKAIE